MTEASEHDMNEHIWSWKREQACEYQSKKLDAQSPEHAEKVAESVAKRDAIAEKVGEAPGPRELVKFEANVRHTAFSHFFLFCWNKRSV